MFVCLSVSFSVPLSFPLYACLSVSFSVTPSFPLYICLTVCVLLRPSLPIPPSLCLSVCLLLRPSLSMSVSLSPSPSLSPSLSCPSIGHSHSNGGTSVLTLTPRAPPCTRLTKSCECGMPQSGTLGLVPSHTVSSCLRSVWKQFARWQVSLLTPLTW